MDKAPKSNMFKKHKKENNLKTNNRWKNFQNTIDKNETNERTNAFQSSGRFDNLRNNSKDRGRRGSRFGKRIYKSRFNKEEIFDYFNNEKNATQREISLFNCIEKKNSKKNSNKEIKKEPLKINTKETMTKDTMTKGTMTKDTMTKDTMTKEKMTEKDKMFILNQYMYEEESDEEQNNDVIEEKTDQTNDIIDF